MPAKKILDLEPFPEDIDPVSFGNWLSGFVDGEGCFQLRYARVVDDKHGKDYRAPGAGFYIKLRGDDTAILQLIQRYWRCGIVSYQKNGDRRNPNPSRLFRVYPIGFLADIVVPHFERYPLRSKKARDFLVWKQGIALLRTINLRKIELLPRKGPRRADFAGTVRRWSAEETQQFLSLQAALSALRPYDPSLDLR